MALRIVTIWRLWVPPPCLQAGGDSASAPQQQITQQKHHSNRSSDFKFILKMSEKQKTFAQSWTRQLRASGGIVQDDWPAFSSHLLRKAVKDSFAADLVAIAGSTSGSAGSGSPAAPRVVRPTQLHSSRDWRRLEAPPETAAQAALQPAAANSPSVGRYTPLSRRAAVIVRRSMPPRCIAASIW